MQYIVKKEEIINNDRGNSRNFVKKLGENE